MCLLQTWLSRSLILSSWHIYGTANRWTGGNFFVVGVSLFLEFDYLLAAGDNKLHVNVFVPSGSDESDCTPGTLICVSDWVCLSLCHSGSFWPTCYRCHSNHSGLCKRETWVCVSQHAVSHHWIWFGGRFIFAALASLWLSFALFMNSHSFGAHTHNCVLLSKNRRGQLASQLSERNTFYWFHKGNFEPRLEPIPKPCSRHTISGVWDVVTRSPPSRGESHIHSAMELKHLKEAKKKRTTPRPHVESQAHNRLSNLLEELQPMRADVDNRAEQRRQKNLKNGLQKGFAISADPAFAPPQPAGERRAGKNRRLNTALI